MDTDSSSKLKVRKRKAAINASFCVKKERNKLYQKVSTVLQKPAAERSKDETEFLTNSKDIVEQITLRKAQRQKVKDRAQEYEDPVEVLTDKCKTLAEAVINSNHLIVYTGAGISTAACIPDYRGSNGIWTLLQQGKDIGLHDLSQAEPTLTHMALYCLYRSGILKHIVSQNCDGLHLRSGIPRAILSEVHGNMYLEVCSKCKPSNHYLRLFDVTEYTARYSHETLRLCYKCGNPLKDTIVHFGERGKLQWPLNWDTACKQADKADVILCLGSSLKVLKKYPWLWCMDKPAKKRPKLYIVNLQWTPKDDHSTLKINGKCDTVIELLMSHLGLTIPQYVRSLDPIFYHATILHDSEVHTTSRIPIEKSLKKPGVSTAKCSTSQDQKESERLNNSVDEPENDEKSTCSRADTSNDLINSKNENSCRIKAEPMDEKTSSDTGSCDPKCLKGEELACSKSTSGLSANIKTESISDERRDEKEDGTSSASRSISQGGCSDEREMKAENDNILNANSNDSAPDNLEVKEETSIDASSDKENHEISNVNDESTMPSKKSVTECEVGKVVVLKDEEKQSSVTVIQEKSIPSAQFVEDSIQVAHEVASIPVENNVEISNGAFESDGIAATSAFAMQTFANGLNLLCAQSLWSDLSVFDTLTNQPILFGRSILGWSDMNTYSYSSTALSNVANGAWNGTASASSATETVASSSTEQTRERFCLFCFEYYCSRSCLFYTSSPSNIPLDANSACLCCGGEEDDEEQQDEPEEDEDKTPARVPSINPGWFGKGYRKKMKYKKR